jgi:hypothetical protein
VAITQKDGQTRVVVSGISGKNRPGMAAVTKRLAIRFKRLI